MLVRSGYPQPAGADSRDGTADTTQSYRERRRRSAWARGQSSGRRNRPMKFARVVVHLAADGGAALGADVVVLAARREHEQEFLSRRRRPATARTEEARRLELLEAVARPAHRPNSTPGL